MTDDNRYKLWDDPDCQDVTSGSDEEEDVRGLFTQAVDDIKTKGVKRVAKPAKKFGDEAEAPTKRKDDKKTPPTKRVVGGKENDPVVHRDVLRDPRINKPATKAMKKSAQATKTSAPAAKKPAPKKKPPPEPAPKPMDQPGAFATRFVDKNGILQPAPQYHNHVPEVIKCSAPGCINTVFICCGLCEKPMCENHTDLNCCANELLSPTTIVPDAPPPDAPPPDAPPPTQPDEFLAPVGDNTVTLNISPVGDDISKFLGNNSTYSPPTALDIEEDSDAETLKSIFDRVQQPAATTKEPPAPNPPAPKPASKLSTGRATKDAKASLNVFNMWWAAQLLVICGLQAAVTINALGGGEPTYIRRDVPHANPIADTFLCVDKKYQAAIEGDLLLFEKLLKRLADGGPAHSDLGFVEGTDTYQDLDTVDKGIVLNAFVRTAVKTRPGSSKERYMPESMRAMLNAIQAADIESYVRHQQQLPPEHRSKMSYSWCDQKHPEANNFKSVRRALTDLRTYFRNTGATRGQGSSTATTALVWAQRQRIRAAYLGYISRLKSQGAMAVFLRGVDIPKNGLNALGRILEAEAALVMIDMGTYGGGRAQQDYSLYRTGDILITKNGYYVVSGDKRKTDRTNHHGQFVGRGPFFVPDREGSLARMELILSGRDGITGTDKKGVPISERLFLRANKKAQEGGTLWRGEVRGFGSWDPVREVASWAVRNEGWSDLTRSLGSLRHMLETGLVRCGVPSRIASAFIGHEVIANDDKNGDKRIKDYTYALGYTMRDKVRTLMVISSGFKCQWHDTATQVDENFVMDMIDNCPSQAMCFARTRVFSRVSRACFARMRLSTNLSPVTWRARAQITCTMFDQEARETMAVSRAAGESFIDPTQEPFGAKSSNAPSTSTAHSARPPAPARPTPIHPQPPQPIQGRRRSATPIHPHAGYRYPALPPHSEFFPYPPRMHYPTPDLPDRPYHRDHFPNYYDHFPGQGHFPPSYFPGQGHFTFSNQGHPHQNTPRFSYPAYFTAPMFPPPQETSEYPADASRLWDPPARDSEEPDDPDDDDFIN